MEKDHHWLDGVPFKISERYRPPPKVNLPLSVQNSLDHGNKNEDTESLISDIMQRARFAVTQVEDFASRRRRESEERLKRLEEHRKQKEEQKRNEADKVCISQVEVDIPEDDEMRQLAEEFNPGSCVTIETVTQTEIATIPKPEPVIPQQPVRKLTSYAEFENGTSPFEDLELKSLNDKAELASVLFQRNGPSQSHYDALSANSMNYSDKPASVSDALSRNSSFEYCPPASSIPFSSYGQSVGLFGSNEPAINRRLKPAEVVSFRSSPEFQYPKSQPEVPQVLPTEHPLPNPYSELSIGKQYLVRQMVDMGFGQPRASRAVKTFGDDSKKVLDHLLLIQSLEEAGHPSNRIEQALLKAGESEAENLKLLLELTNQFVDLGFKEEAAIDALVRSKNDRDAALDLLVM